MDQTPVDQNPENSPPADSGAELVESPGAESAAAPPDVPPAPRWPAGGDLGSKSWLPYVLPFLVYMVVGSFEPSNEKMGPPPVGFTQEQWQKEWDASHEHNTVYLMGIRYHHYPMIYSIKIAATAFTMLLCLPGYWKFPFRVSWLAIGIGVVGVVIWIALCWLHLEPKILGPMGLMKVEEFGERPAFNPFEELKSNPSWMYGFLAIRFLGLVLIVPIIEEFFLRGFLMRFVMDADWWEIPFGHVNFLAIIVGTAVPMLMHPGELFAAFVWFSMVTWLMIRTKNIWDCVAAHTVTNLLLGLYVITTGSWYLW